MGELRFELDRINQATWSSASALDLFAASSGPLDPGETAVLSRVAAEAAGQPILDIGVGGGRTVPLLRAISDDYIGIDYLEETVALSRSRFPGVRIDHRDARDLSTFAEHTFALVFFSFNGIDGVGHSDRRTVLAEIYRVLRPRGLFAYSTHNLDHLNAGRAPWDPRWLWRDSRRLSRRVVRHTVRLPRAVRAYKRSRPLTARGDGWATLVDPGYDFGLLTHFVTLPEALRELGEIGFDREVETYRPTGERLLPDDDTSTSALFHLIARRP